MVGVHGALSEAGGVRKDACERNRNRGWLNRGPNGEPTGTRRDVEGHQAEVGANSTAASVTPTSEQTKPRSSFCARRA